DRLRDDHGGPDRVEQRERVEVPSVREVQHHEQPAADRTPDRQPAPPDLDRADEPVLVPLVAREEVVDPGADHAGDHDGYRDFGYFFRVVTGLSPADAR